MCDQQQGGIGCLLGNAQHLVRIAARRFQVSPNPMKQKQAPQNRKQLRRAADLWRSQWHGLRGSRGRHTKLADSPQHLPAITEDDAQFLQVLIGQVGKD
jgi:hypothetical protein